MAVALAIGAAIKIGTSIAAGRRRKKARKILKVVKQAQFAQQKRQFMKQFRFAQGEILLRGSVGEGGLESSRFQGQQASLRTTQATILADVDEATRLSVRAGSLIERAESLEAFGDIAQGITGAAGGLGG